MGETAVAQELPVRSPSAESWVAFDIDHEFYGFGDLIRPRFAAWAPGRAKVIAQEGDHLLNRHGRLHGGAGLTLMDMVMGMACFYRGPGFDQIEGVTISMNAQFLASVGPGPVTAIGRVTRQGRKTVFAESEILDAGGQVCFLGTGVFKVISRPG